MNSLHTLAIAALLTASTAFADDRGDSPVTATHPSIQVEYADTLQGVQAMFAVRACASEDMPHRYGTPRGLIPDTPPVQSLIEERQAAIGNDIVVRVIDNDGREISRHEGANDVCGYARIAAAFLAQGHAVVTWSGK